MAALARFVSVSEDDIACFLEENENKNTVRKTNQDVGLLKAFLKRKSTQELEELSPQDLDACLQEFVVVVWKQDGSDYEPSSLHSLVASIERYLKKNYGYSIINSLEFSGNTLFTSESKGEKNTVTSAGEMFN